MNILRTEKAAYLSIGVNSFLVAVKWSLAALSGSIGLMADAWHSASDILVDSLVILGVKISKKGWKIAAIIENIIALVISALIFIAAYALAVKSLTPEKVEPIKYLPVVLIGTVACAALSRWIGRYKKKVGKEEGSTTLVADGHHSTMDMYTTAVVAVGLLGQMIGLRLDHIAAVVVVLFVARIGLKIAIMAIKGLIKKEAFGTHISETKVGKAVTFFGSGTAWIIRKISGTEFTWTGAIAWTLDKRYKLAGALAIIVAILYVLSGFYTVSPSQVALVTVFGKAASEATGPGVHYALPAPIGKVRYVPAGQVLRLEVGFRTIENGDPATVPSSRAAYEWHSRHTVGLYTKQSAEAIMLTGDENMIDVNTVVNYKISDPFAYGFGFADQESMLRGVAENALRLIVATTPIDDILTGSRQGIQQQAKSRIQKECDEMKMGIEVVSVEMQDVHPPVDVVRSFRDVASAKEEKAQTVNNAMADQYEQVPAARAKAAEDLFLAQGYLLSKTLNAQGDADRFSLMVEQAQKAKDVTMYRMYIEALEKALANKRKFIISPRLEPGALDLRIFARGDGMGQSKVRKGATK